MSYTKRRVESEYMNSTPLHRKLLMLEEKVETLQQLVNNIIEERGVR